MKFHDVGSCALATLLMAGASMPAAGADCSGYEVLVTQSTDTLDVGAEHMVSVIRWWSILTIDDPNPSYNLAIGKCQDSLLTTAAGKTQATGYCARWDRIPGASGSPSHPARKKVSGRSPAVRKNSRAATTRADFRASMPAHGCQYPAGAGSR